MIETLKRWWDLKRHPYKKSAHRALYVSIAKEYGIKPDHVYDLAHGEPPHDYDDLYIMQQLVKAGVLQRKG